MKKFLKPSLLKIIWFVLFFIILYYLWGFFIVFPNSSLCPLYLNIPVYSSAPLSIAETIRLIPQVLTGNYDHCYNISKSLITARNIVYYGSLSLLPIASYIFACGIVTLVKILTNKKTNKI